MHLPQSFIASTIGKSSMKVMFVAAGSQHIGLVPQAQWLWKMAPTPTLLASSV